MAKSQDAFRTISEVADWLDTPAHVLRFWESRFTQVKPVKRAGGRRYYRPADMELLSGIKKLLHEDGMTIKGVQKLLRSEGIKHVAAMSQPMEEMGGDAATKVPKTPVELPMEAPKVEEITSQVISFPPVQDTKDITPEAAPTETPELPRQTSFLDADPAFIAPISNEQTSSESELTGEPELEETVDIAPPMDSAAAENISEIVTENVFEASEDQDIIPEETPLEQNPTVSEEPSVEIEESAESDLTATSLPETTDAEEIDFVAEDQSTPSEQAPLLAESVEDAEQHESSEGLPPSPSEPNVDAPLTDTVETLQEVASEPDLVRPDPSEVPPIGGADDFDVSIQESTTDAPADPLDVLAPPTETQDVEAAQDAPVEAPSADPEIVENDLGNAIESAPIEDDVPTPLSFISDTPDDPQDDAESFAALSVRQGLSKRAAPFSPQKKSELQALTLRLTALRKSYGDVSKGAPKN